VTSHLSFRGSTALGKKYAQQVSRIPEDARFLHGLGSLRTRRQQARLFEGRQRFGVQIEFGPRDFVFLSHGGQKLRQPIANCLFGARLWNRREPGR
jgi:hypothetical protein